MGTLTSPSHHGFLQVMHDCHITRRPFLSGSCRQRGIEAHRWEVSLFLFKTRMHVTTYFTYLTRSNRSSSANEGTILVRRTGQGYAKWGLICDDGWHARAGQVICRQLGYKKVEKVTRYNTFNSANSCKCVCPCVCPSH